ncbi:MAG TPA: AAA family ATPase, partial [Acidimicrobiales bacterium]|nr:AAA family ATPase [Acidimicrobiales bacterium]
MSVGSGSTIIPCPMIVGRATEVGLLTEALASACSDGGRGRLVFVVGEAGIGKSRLVHDVIAEAAGRRVRVLRGRAVPGATAAAFRPLVEALAPLVPDLETKGELRPWLPVLAAIVPTLHASPATDLAAPVLGEAMLRVLGAAAAAGGLLVIEDLHWADPETVAVLEHLSDHLERVPVLCLATVRSGESPAADDFVRRMADRRSAAVVTLDRLNDAQVAAMVHACTGGVAEHDLERVVALSDGVPFLVEEMLVSPGLPASFADGVAARLAELSADDRHVLATAAA